MFKDLKVRGKIIYLLGENTGIPFHDLGLCNDFLDIMPRVQAIKFLKLINWTSSIVKIFML